MVFATHFGSPTVVGHTMLFRRSTADRFGGIRTLASYLAEDHMSGQAMRQLGLQTRIMTVPVLRTVGKQKVETFWARHVRWGRMRKAHVPIPFFFEPLTYAFPAGIIGALAGQATLGINPFAFFALHLLAWFVGDLVIMNKIRSEVTATTPLWWLIRESLAMPMWVHILSGNSVNWRGIPLRLELGGTAKPLFVRAS
jgi:hypothetical protein